jgi:hypothetical protein
VYICNPSTGKAVVGRSWVQSQSVLHSKTSMKEKKEIERKERKEEKRKQKNEDKRNLECL